MHPHRTERSCLQKGLSFLTVLIAFLVFPSFAEPEKQVIEVDQEPSQLLLAILKRISVREFGTSKKDGLDLAALVLAYKPFIERLEFSEDKATLGFKKGLGIPWTDGRVKAFQKKLDNPDLQDTMSFDYPRGSVVKPIPRNHDPGRFRVEALLKGVYGSSKEQVRKNMVPVRFCGKSVMFNSRNGAAEALTRVGKDLEILLKARSHLREYIFPLSGTFNWRKIKGTDRLSPHSFGIAIDLNARMGAYWRWDKGRTDIFEMRRRYPFEIVSVFEKHGFIWGGKWYHYDLMHFEYRPEFLMKEGLERASPANY